jgi:hypothetical protein
MHDTTQATMDTETRELLERFWKGSTYLADQAAARKAEAMRVRLAALRLRTVREMVA